MRIVQFLGPARALSVQSVPEPAPEPGQAVIRVSRCGICGTDVHMTSGSVLDYPIGTTLGHEYAGEVVAVGRGVTRIRVGDHVTAMPLSACGNCEACLDGMPHHCPHVEPRCGGFAEYTSVDERYTFILPRSMSLIDGALVEPVASALRGVRKAEVQPGNRVLIIGAGSIGMSAVFWARRFGAAKIVVAAKTDSKSSLAKTMGADILLAESDGPAAILEALGGPADTVIECAGARGAIASAVNFVRRRGTVTSLGGCAGPDTFHPVFGMQKEIRLLFSVSYNIRDFGFTVDTMSQGGTELRAMVSEVISIDDVPEKIASMRSGSHHCKVHVDPTIQRTIS
jgi:threonine dehydrogenase-like Zn-dependent dehydrogenase